MAFKCNEISEARMSEAMEMRDWVGQGVNARRDLGASEAVWQVARELGVKPRRVLAIMRGEVRRVWADEWAKARAWHAADCAKQAAICEHKARMYHDQRAALIERMENSA